VAAEFLQYFWRWAAGTLLAVAFVEVIPESVRLSELRTEPRCCRRRSRAENCAFDFSARMTMARR